jgi:deoxyribodipyrimidine photo-lyase
VTAFAEPTRAAGLARLAGFVPRAGRAYGATRNTDTGPGARENVSMLSPFLRWRLLTEGEVLQAVLARHALSSADKFVSEVCWRGYFKGHLETRPQIWTRYVAGRDAALAACEADPAVGRAVQRAQAGETGIEGFDDWAREIVATGYLHNHARMWFASIWIFTLRLPWELGADFTLRHFIDGDPASNTLSWRWVAGLHTPGKTYLARPDNIATYTQGRFTPQGLAREARALTEPPIGAARALPPADPVPPDGPLALLLTPEDCEPESLLREAGIDPSRVRLILHGEAEALRSPLPAAAQVLAFARGALSDAVARATTLTGAQAVAVPGLAPEAVVEALQAHGASRLVTARPPVGPTQAALAAVGTALGEAGIEWTRLQRGWDDALWPHATRGFFPLRERIPEIVARQGLLPMQDLFG